MSSPAQPMPEPGGVAAVDRALAIVNAVAEQPEPSSLAELASATGLYKSTILRLLASLEKAGYAQRLRDGRYGLGPTAFRLSIAYGRANPLRHHVLPALRDLVALGSESASFHVQHGQGTRLCLFRVDSGHATLDRIHAGDILPLERGAAGRVLLAFRPDPPPALAALRTIQFAYSVGEREAGCSGMAAPVFEADGTLVGALSLSGPSSRITDNVVAEWQPKLIAAASEITRALGGRYPAVPA